MQGHNFESGRNEAPVAVVTGASSGVGKATAKALARLGWHVSAHGRDPERIVAAEAEIRAAAAGGQVNLVCGDLSLMSGHGPHGHRDRQAGLYKVHALVNNAGGVRSERVITPEGNEATFAGNHLGHFLLTNRLLPLLRAAVATSKAGTVRILSVSSTGHEGCPGLDWNSNT